MSKINVEGLISLLLGGLIIGFQALGNLMKESYNWKAVTIYDLMEPTQVHWVNAVPISFVRSGLDYLMSSPLYLVFFVFGGICLALSFILRK